MTTAAQYTLVLDRDNVSDDAWEQSMRIIGRANRELDALGWDTSGIVWSRPLGWHTYAVHAGCQAPDPRGRT
jgi:hypothetical protein